MEKKYRVGIIGGTGYVGQRFVTLLDGHPWFDTVLIAASNRSAGKTYKEAVSGRWKLKTEIPGGVKDIVVRNAADYADYMNEVDFVFSAVDMDKNVIRELEEYIAKTETPVVSNNSAHRWTSDVPMIIPELNPDHTEIIHSQRKRLGIRKGFVAVKPNCSIQSYVPALHPLLKYGIESISVCTYQAISGAGKTFADWPEMVENVIPYIGGEEEKSENEPLKIWGRIENGRIEKNKDIKISSQCYRVSVQEGHMAAVSVKFKEKPSIEKIIEEWDGFKGEPQLKGLPSAPEKMLKYYQENDRPQSRPDCDYENGMGVTIGRLREDNIFDYKFACLSHNTIRGAAGGAVLMAELLVSRGFIQHK